MPDPYLGEIRMFSGSFAPVGWAFCDGSLLPISQNNALFSLLGTTYGGDGQTSFALPNLSSRLPIHVGSGFGLGQKAGVETVTLTAQQIPAHSHQAVGASTLTASDPANTVPAQWGDGEYSTSAASGALAAAAVAQSGASQPHGNLSPYLAINFIIALNGIFPSQNSGGSSSDPPFVGEVRLIAFSFPPYGWALCNGQTQQISQSAAMFSLLGTTYGGDGRTTYALPDLRGRAPVHVGGNFTLGQNGGEVAHTLSVGELPAHTHAVAASSAPGTVSTPVGNFPAHGAKAAYGSTADLLMSSGAVGSSGGGQPHENMPPYLALYFVIALNGVFPSRS